MLTDSQREFGPRFITFVVAPPAWSNTTEEHHVAEYPVRRPVQSLPIHPGEVLREDVLLALRLSVTAAAKQLGVPRQTLHRILAERGRTLILPTSQDGSNDGARL